MTWSLPPSDARIKTGALIIPISEEKTLNLPAVLKRETVVNDLITLVWNRKEFRGKKKQLMVIPLAHDRIERIVLVGLGEAKELTERTLMHLMGSAVKAASSKPIDECAIVAPIVPKFSPTTLATIVGIATTRALYQFKLYKSKDEKSNAKDEHEIKEVSVVGVEARARNQWQKVLKEIATLAPFFKNQRDWGNMPSNDCTPTFMATQAMAFAKANPKLTVTVMDKDQIKKAGMGALYAVSRGAGEHPRFIIMEYWGKGKTFKPFVFVGKGITFDTGGISLKPSEKMHEMKFDMLGAASVLNATAAIAALKLPVNIVALAPCTENCPGAEAYKPGDVLRALNGKTMEILNTDAEGRVILADALCWAHRYDPAAVIDIATLTGSAVVALGNEGTPLVTTSSALRSLLIKASTITQDRLLEFPLWEEFKEAVKSEVADVRNSTEGYGGGILTGAAFLEYFSKPMPWAHLDIAGTGWYASAKPWTAAGTTDVGLHLLVEVAKQWKAAKKV